MLQSMRSAAKPIMIILAITFVGGFLFADASGLLGRAPVTAGTPVATVNGRDITYQQWINTVEALRQQAEAQKGSALTGDERARLEQQAFDEMVSDILLQDEYAKRGITVSAEEIQEAARYSPPRELMQAPALQTDGQFDPEKYQRYLSSPQVKASGQLVQLENYYREEIKKQKLYDQVASDVYVTDARLWSIWQDTRDSAQVTFAAFRPDLIPDSTVSVSDAEIRDWFDDHKADLERPGMATLSVVSIPRTITAADSAATRARVAALRAEILGGAKFEDVAKRESADSGSAANGGELPAAPLAQYVPQFADAARALKPGELSQPVLSPFGYHLIRVDSRKGDTVTAHHILVRVQQSDSSATRTDREADELGRLAASATDPAKFDSAAKRLGLQVQRGPVMEGEPMRLGARTIPDASSFAFGGAQIGETSELLSDDDAYYLVRLDSLRTGGVPKYEDARDLVRRELLQRKKNEKLLPRAQQLAAAAAAGTLEAAAQAHNVPLQTTGLFSRVSAVPGLGQLNQAIGAAFALPVGAVSAPVMTPVGVYVLRVDRRINADRAAFDAQKSQQRAQHTDALRQRRVSEFMENLRKSANVADKRREVFARGRGETEES